MQVAGAQLSARWAALVENQLRALVAPDADTVGWLGGAGIL